VVIISGLAAFWLLIPKPTLIDLQKEILTAQSREDTLNVLKKLDEYYLTMPIPETVRLEVEEAVDGLIREFESTKHKYTSEKLKSALDSLDEDIYLVEFKIRGVVRNAMVARSLDDHSTSRAILAYAKSLADTVKTKLGDQYWPWWLNEAEKYTKTEARNWLLADRASRLCFNQYTENFEKGEKLAAFGLQRLKQIQDERIQLDLTQGVFVILYQFRGLYDLAYPIAEKGIQIADKINYRKRATGLTFNYAVELQAAGRNKQALSKYLETMKRIRIISELPRMDYYEITAHLNIANVNQLLGNYDQTLSICDEIEKLKLNNSYRHVLHNTKGITYVYLGKYDLAETEYHKALKFAIADNDTINQVAIISNLGKLYFRLTEYDKASDFYEDAMSLLLKFAPRNYAFRCRNLIRQAELEAARNRRKNFNNNVLETKKYIAFLNNPIVKGRYIVSLGQLSLDINNYEQANSYFLQAIAHYESFGIIRYALETKIKLIQSLIDLPNYQKAKEQLNTLYISARQFNDIPTQIDVLGLSSYIAYKENNIELAVQNSNQLINKIEELSSEISNLDILTTFRQKIHPFLKNAVTYELVKGRIDSAFVKLDYLKARESKHRFTQNDGKINPIRIFIDIDSLKAQLTEKRMLINYLVMEDTLYAFVLHQKGLNLFKRAIHIDNLRRLGNDYIDVIRHSRKYLDPYQPTAFQVNYDSVMSLGRQLYEILLDWPELKNRLQNTDITYIIPDDILYGIPFSCLNDSGELQSQFLIQKTAIVNLPSAVFLQSSQSYTIAQSFHNLRPLICADREEFPGVEKLVKDIKSKFPLAEELIIDKPVIEVEDVLIKLNEGYDVYFLIGHSIPNLKFPDLSTIQLTPLRKSDKMPFRVDISLSDLKLIDWSPAEMVFLIGCETAVGKLYEGSGFSGFQQNILTRGAKGVMASSWKIDNTIAFQQFEEFLDFWESRKHPAIALQSIEKKWIQQFQNDPFYNMPHPYLWEILTLSQTIKHY
jgi:CHAT domain-containing protein